MPLRSGTVPALDIIGIYVLTLWGGEGTSRLGMVHTESSIVLMILEVYRVRSRISSVGARLRPRHGRFPRRRLPRLGRPAKGAIFAPSSRCSACSGVFSKGSSLSDMGFRPPAQNTAPVRKHRRIVPPLSRCLKESRRSSPSTGEKPLTSSAWPRRYDHRPPLSRVPSPRGPCA